MLSLLVALVAGCRSAAPADRPAAVGRTTRDWQDETRTRWDGTGVRPLATTIWYPAAEGALESRSIVGFPGAPFFELGWVALDTPIAPGRYPLVVLSHGTGGSNLDLSWLAEWLAARGSIVAAVTHHGNSIAADDLAPQGFFLWWERASDLSLIIDALQRDPDFGSRIDFDRVGAAGFSLGGHTVVLLAGARVGLAAYRAWCETEDAVPANCSPPPEALELLDTSMDPEDPTTAASLARSDFSYEDVRVRAVFSIAPAVGNAMTPASLSAIQVPVRVVVGADDTMAPPAVNAEYIVQHAKRASLLLLPDVDHYTFLPTCGWAGRWFLDEICAERAELPRAEVHRTVARDAARFFGEHLASE
jgi:predicted dienelactone hydrolase